MAAAAPSETRSFAPDQERMVDLRAALERLALTGVVDRGCVTVIGLDAVRDRLGERWEARRERIWEGVNAHLARRLGPHDLHVRLDEVSLLLALGDTPEQALVLSLNLLKELLTFFLGQQTLADLRIDQVTAIAAGRIERTPVDPATVPVLAPPSPRAADRTQGHSGWSALSFAASDGRELEIAFVFEPVLSLKFLTKAGLRMIPVLRDRVSGLSLGPRWRRTLPFADVLGVDLMAIDAARPLFGAADAPKVMIPLSVETLFSVRGRAAIMGHLHGAGEPSGVGMVVEVLGVDGGTPTSGLAEATTVMGRYCKVVARSDLSAGCWRVLRECALTGVSMNAYALPPDGPGIGTALLGFSRLAKAIAPLRFAFGLPDASVCDLAAGVGLTHVSVRPAGERTAAAAVEARSALV